jgi:hypothetical protein
MHDKQGVSLQTNVHPNATRLPKVTPESQRNMSVMVESSVSGLCTVNSLIIVFRGYLCGHYILWEASVHFQFLCYDHLLWKNKELAIQNYGVSVCDVDSPVKWQHILFTWGWKW